MPPSGWAVLAAAPRTMPAMAPEGQPYTMFSGAFAEALQTGAAHLKQHFSLADLAAETRRRITLSYGHDRAILPQSHAPMQNEGDLSRVPLFENKAIDVALASVIMSNDNDTVDEIVHSFKRGLKEARKGALHDAYGLYLRTADGDVKARLASFLSGVTNDDSREVSLLADQYVKGLRGAPEPRSALGQTGPSRIKPGYPRRSGSKMDLRGWIVVNGFTAIYWMVFIIAYQHDGPPPWPGSIIAYGLGAFLILLCIFSYPRNRGRRDPAAKITGGVELGTKFESERLESAKWQPDISAAPKNESNEQNVRGRLVVMLMGLFSVILLNAVLILAYFKPWGTFSRAHDPLIEIKSENELIVAVCVLILLVIIFLGVLGELRTRIKMRKV